MICPKSESISLGLGEDLLLHTTMMEPLCGEDAFLRISGVNCLSKLGS